MKEKPENNKQELSDLKRYIRGEMTKRQENAFQRKLQRDPFSAEAVEGLETLDPEESMADLSKLEKRLDSRIARRKKYIYYRIAASVAVLMIISSIFLVVNRKDKAEEVGGIPAPAVMVEKSESAPVSIPEEKSAREETEDTRENPKPRVMEEKKAEIALADVPDEAKNDPGVVTEPADVKGIAAADQVLVADKAEVQAAPAAAERDAAAMEYVAADMARKAAKAEAMPAAFREGGRIAPEPVNGRNEFEKYLKEKIRIPEMLPAGDSVSLEVSITISSTGQIKSIRIIDSPGEEFSKEARRLIEEGPAWNPAKSGGVQVNDSVRLKILFRR
jgi:hypothetical protein